MEDIGQLEYKPPRVIFETRRLIVRDWSPADADRVYDIYGRWEVSRWLDPTVMPDLAAAQRLMARWSELNADPLYGAWAVERKSDGKVAGTVLLKPLPNGRGEVEVGWHFHPDSWGLGLATEAARGAIQHGKKNGIHQIYAVVRPDNEASLAVCRRLDMRSLGRTDKWYGVVLELFVV